jgi:predicted O-methyltransferase YrrM
MTQKVTAKALVGSAQRRLAHRLTGIDTKSFRRAAENDFRQVEDLLALHVLLQPARPLPRTRGWAACPDVLRMLTERVLDDGPVTVVEFGSGSSTIVLALALMRNDRGHVFAFDHEPTYAELTRQAIARHGLGDWATVIDAPLVPIRDPELRVTGGPTRWYSTSDLPPDIELVFVDGPPEASDNMARYPALPAIADRLVAGAALFMDDAHRAHERNAVALWRERYPKATFSTVATERGTALVTWPSDDR